MVMFSISSIIMTSPPVSAVIYQISIANIQNTVKRFNKLCSTSSSFILIIVLYFTFRGR